jgi:AcrR family transcriptional regulator
MNGVTPAQLPVLQPVELPVLGGEPHERADAARNRQKVLDAAACLFAREGAERVSMEAIAAHAGVGKGTLFRRFGDRASLARAVLGENERRLQEEIIRGPAPLGPGAPPAERLSAFAAAYLEFLETHGQLLVAAEFGSPGFRLIGPPYVFYRTHVALLLREAGLGERAEYLSDVLLAPLAASTFRYQHEVRGFGLGRLADDYRDLVGRVVRPA